MTPEPRHRSGSQFGPYRLRRLLGRGGFGEVYEAEDTTMNRTVALKLIADPYAHDPVFRQRLYREARTAGRLQDPHVVPIHRCAEVDGQLFIDMRLIRGSDLAAVLAESGALEPARAVAIVGQIASALDAAHAQQMVHRDIKPANILLADRDFACLVDFGLAYAAADTKLTGSAATAGTFAYVAPERLDHSEVSASSDVYALACVLYECLTGSLPYTGEIPAVITAHLMAPIPRPSRNRAGIPPGFDDVIARGMAKKPGDRFASAGELARAAEAALTGAAPAPSRWPARPNRRTLKIVALAATILAVVGALAAFGLGSGTAPAPTPLPFTGLHNPCCVAAGNDGSVYVVDLGSNRVLKLAAGAGVATQLPFAGLKRPSDVKVDAAESVYVTDLATNRVLKLDGDTTTELLLDGLNEPWCMDVDAAGNVYAVDLRNKQVLKLSSGVTTTLPFTGLNEPWCVAAGPHGDVYVTDYAANRVVKLAAGGQTELPFTGLSRPGGVAVDTAGTVYITDEGNNRVLKLAPGAGTQTELAFTGLDRPTQLSVDADGTVYVADYGNDRILKLAPN